MTVFGGLQWLTAAGFGWKGEVSIPMTVFGGLQSVSLSRPQSATRCFNTDDGIWRAAMFATNTTAASAMKFQYR